MPAYNFKGQFAKAVESGRKPHTIRPRRKRPTKVGDTLYLYTGMRTKQCRLLKKTICTNVLPIRINADDVLPVISLGGRLLSFYETEALAKKDGFFMAHDLFRFFRETYGLIFDGELIEWRT